MPLPSGSSVSCLFLLLLLSPANSAAEIACLTNAACTGARGTGSGCLTTRTCPGGCLSRRYTRPSGELLALRLDCARAEESAGAADIHYCRHRPDCNDPSMSRLRSSEDDISIDGSKRGGRRKCLDGNGQSRTCRSEAMMCMTIGHLNRSAGCQADMLQLYELVNTSRIARYAVAILICRDRPMCTGTATSLKLISSSPAPTTAARLAERTSDENFENADSDGDGRLAGSGCLRKLLRWRKTEDSSAGQGHRVNASGGAVDDDRALALCMRQLWLSNHRESSGEVGDSNGSGAGGSGDSGNGLVLKALTLAVCLLCAALLAVLVRGLLARRRRLRAARHRRRRQRQELQLRQQQQQQQQQLQQQLMNSPTGSAVTTLTLPRRAVQLLLQFDEQLQQQQQQQQQQQPQMQQSLHQCVSTVQSSPCATIRHAPRQPHLLLATSSEDADLDEDTFV